jgi:uncharacterized protein YhaN
LLIGYFGINAYTAIAACARGDLDQQIAELSNELAGLRAERINWERRISLLQPESIDPDISMSVRVRFSICRSSRAYLAAQATDRRQITQRPRSAKIDRTVHFPARDTAPRHPCASAPGNFGY